MSFSEFLIKPRNISKFDKMRSFIELAYVQENSLTGSEMSNVVAKMDLKAQDINNGRDSEIKEGSVALYIKNNRSNMSILNEASKKFKAEVFELTDLLDDNGVKFKECFDESEATVIGVVPGRASSSVNDSMKMEEERVQLKLPIYPEYPPREVNDKGMLSISKQTAKLLADNLPIYQEKRDMYNFGRISYSSISSVDALGKGVRCFISEKDWTDFTKSDKGQVFFCAKRYFLAEMLGVTSFEMRCFKGPYLYSLCDNFWAEQDAIRDLDPTWLKPKDERLQPFIEPLREWAVNKFSGLPLKEQGWELADVRKALDKNLPKQWEITNVNDRVENLLKMSPAELEELHKGTIDEETFFAFAEKFGLSHSDFELSKGIDAYTKIPTPLYTQIKWLSTCADAQVPSSSFEEMASKLRFNLLTKKDSEALNCIATMSLQDFIKEPKAANQNNDSISE